MVFILRFLPAANKCWGGGYSHKGVPFFGEVDAHNRRSRQRSNEKWERTLRLKKGLPKWSLLFAEAGHAVAAFVNVANRGRKEGHWAIIRWGVFSFLCRLGAHHLWPTDLQLFADASPAFDNLGKAIILPLMQSAFLRLRGRLPPPS